MSYKFSVGKVTLNSLETVYTKQIDYALNIDIDYSMATHREVEATGRCIAEYDMEEKMMISFEYTDDISTSMILGRRYDITLTPGTAGGGLTVNLNNCKLVGYTIRTVQDQFAIIKVTFSKIDSINSNSGDPALTKQRIKFGSVYIGDSAYLVPSYQGNSIARIIPTALGTIFQTTSITGGGLLTLAVKGIVKHTSRLALEQYVTGLLTSLSTSKQTLTVEYGGTSYTLTNCVFVRASVSNDNKTFAEIEVEFQKSAY